MCSDFARRSLFNICSLRNVVQKRPAAAFCNSANGVAHSKLISCCSGTEKRALLSLSNERKSNSFEILSYNRAAMFSTTKHADDKSDKSSGKDSMSAQSNPAVAEEESKPTMVEPSSGEGDKVNAVKAEPETKDIKETSQMVVEKTDSSVSMASVEEDKIDTDAKEVESEKRFGPEGLDPSECKVEVKGEEEASESKKSDESTNLKEDNKEKLGLFKMNFRNDSENTDKDNAQDGKKEIFSSSYRQKGSANKSNSPPSSDERVPSKSRSYEGRTTRGFSIMRERERFLAMSTDEKRKLYARKNYVPLNDVETWSEFYSEEGENLKDVYPSEKDIKKAMKDFPKIEADNELNAKISLFEGDITSLEIDGIVNAANRSLLGGGGVDGAIHRGAGSQLLEECRTLAGCDTGDAKTTCGYKLPAKYVIHTVGPMTTTPSQLHSCYVRCFEEMQKHNMRSIAFCCISTGIYGYPNDMATHEALGTTRKFLMELKKNNKLDSIDRVIFCLFLPIDVELYQSWMQVYFPIDSENDNSNNSSPDKGKSLSATDVDSPRKGKETGSDDVNVKMEVEDAKGSEEKERSEELMDAEDGTEVTHMKTETEEGLPDKKSKMESDGN